MTSAKGLPDSGPIDVPLGANPLPSFSAPPASPPLPPPMARPIAKSELKPVAQPPATIQSPPKNGTSPPPPVPLKKSSTPPSAPSPSPSLVPPVPALPTASKPAVTSNRPSVSNTVAASRPIPKVAARGVAVVPPESEEPEPEEEISFSVEDLYRDSPAWLTSLVVHMLVVIILGLIYIAPKQERFLEIVASLSQNGNNPELTNGPDIPVDTKPDLTEDPIYVPDGDPVENPIATPLNVAPLENGLTPTDPSLQHSSAMVERLLAGRETGSKKNLAIKFGATQGTLDAVDLALGWIVRQQNKAGHWSLEKPYSGGAPFENRNAATAMAMLALQGDGNTHLRGQFKDNVAGGLKTLLKSQAGNGALHQGSPGDHHMMYTHALATIALCELYAMTSDSNLRTPCEKAVEYLVKVQASEGGWRYRPGIESDMSVTGWCVMALQSARAAKLNVPNDTLQRVTRFLDDCATTDYGYSYLPDSAAGSTYAMSAEALLARQLLGMKRADPAMSTGVEVLYRSDKLEWSRGGSNSVYGWYYATQVFHHYGGRTWENWNNKMRVVIPANQQKNGAERGSWAPDADYHGTQGGRLYVTCLCTYMLEVYWRHLPLYKEVYEGKIKPTDD
jgi:hypothetical protein